MLRSVIVGSGAHLIETATLGHLLDRLMVERQALPALPSVLHAIRSVGQKRGFYQGFKWNAMSSAIKGAGGWSIHNLCNRAWNTFWPQKTPSDPPFSFTFLVASSTALAETTLFLCPLERFKIFEMTKRPSAKELGAMIRENRISFVYRGWTWMIFQKSWSWMNYLGVYQQLRRPLLRYNEQRPLSDFQKIALGFGTGAAVACLNAPMDFLKTQLQKEAAEKSKSVLNIALSVLHSHGWRGLFRGLGLKMIRTGWSTGIVTLALSKSNALPQSMKV